MYNRGVEVLTMTSTPLLYNKGVEVIVRTSTPLLYIYFTSKMYENKT